MLVCGVDEAGRGPVIGPMVFSIVAVEKKDEDKLRDMGVTDSKMLEVEIRNELFDKIKRISKEHLILSLSAADITEWMGSASLNEIEAIKTAELLNSLESEPKVCYVDCPDTVPTRYENNIRNLCKKETKIVAEHKADMKYISSAAASILAKVTRDREIEALAEEYGQIGSGYPGDPLTRQWLDIWWEENQCFPDIVRKKWSTVTRKAQLKLTQW
jgi:ribonuclease HII